MPKSYFSSTLLTVFASVLLLSQYSLANQKMNNLFSRQLALRAQATTQNAELIKQKINQIRYEETYLGEATAKYVNSPIDAAAVDAFSTGYLLNPKFKSLEFKTGDVILVRGKSIISATIGAATESLSQFSHLALVYIDESTQKEYIIEALIGKGAIIRNLSEIMTEGSPKMVLYRNKDSQIAKKAADIAFATVNASHINYDTKFNMNDYSEVYCAELVRMAYDKATQGAEMLPNFPSIFGPKMKNTLKSLQAEMLMNSVLFAPADIDTDNRFDLVAEWSDYKSSLAVRIKDQVLLNLLARIEQGGSLVNYKQIIDNAKLMSAQPQDGQVIPSTPADAASSNFESMLQTVETALDQITALVMLKNDEFFKKNGKNMNQQQIKILLDSSANDPAIAQILVQTGLFK